MKKISLSKLNELFAVISKNYDLYMPISKAGKVNYALWTEDSKADLDILNTVKSPKGLFFPQSEDIVSFKTKGKTIDIIEEYKNVEPFVVFGVRACDNQAFDVLDKVFLSEPVDEFYKIKREKGIIITSACFSPEESCFCKTFNIDPLNPKGDIETYRCKDYLYWNPLTEKGMQLTDSLTGLFEKEEVEKDCDELKAFKENAQKIFDKLPLKDLKIENLNSKDTLNIFDSPEWEKLSASCVGCGTCTFVCPTCQCYDILDFKANGKVKRFRCWDSCMYSDFTKMAHGNPRTTQLQRFRQRFMHKLVYFPENNNGEFSCVGCGRCVVKCPVSMNIVKVIKAFGGKKNV